MDTPVGSVEAPKSLAGVRSGGRPLHQLIASSQAERNILLCPDGVNRILWCPRF